MLCSYLVDARQPYFSGIDARKVVVSSPCRHIYKVCLREGGDARGMRRQSVQHPSTPSPLLLVLARLPCEHRHTSSPHSQLLYMSPWAEGERLQLAVCNTDTILGPRILGPDLSRFEFLFPLDTLPCHTLPGRTLCFVDEFWQLYAEQYAQRPPQAHVDRLVQDRWDDGLGSSHQPCHVAVGV